MKGNNLMNILKSAILLELRGEAFYRKVASSTDNPDVKKIFEIMAEEEVLHSRVLKEKYSELKKGNKLTEPEIQDNKNSSVTGFVLSESMKSRIAAAGFESAAIAAAIDMETRAIDLYTRSAENSTNDNEKKLFTWLAEWERGHYKLLNDLDSDLKERIWNDNQFWPF